jgi:hypothetical protein
MMYFFPREEFQTRFTTVEPYRPLANAVNDFGKV